MGIAVKRLFEFKLGGVRAAFACLVAVAWRMVMRGNNALNPLTVDV
jgi:hypothetical protein